MQSRLILPFLFLTGCTTTVPIAQIEQRPPISIPQATPIVTQPVKWQVMNASDLALLVTQLAKNPKQAFVVYALDADNFKALLTNLDEIKRYLEEQQKINEFLVGVVNSETTPPPAPTAPPAK